MTDDRTLLWHEAFRKAQLDVAEFRCDNAGYLEHVVWRGTVPDARSQRVRHGYTARLFRWREAPSLDIGERNDESLAFQVFVSGLAASAPRTWLTIELPFDAVDYSHAAVMNFEVNGPIPETWLVVRRVEVQSGAPGLPFLFRVLPPTWALPTWRTVPTGLTLADTDPHAFTRVIDSHVAHAAGLARLVLARLAVSPSPARFVAKRFWDAADELGAVAIAQAIAWDPSSIHS